MSYQTSMLAVPGIAPISLRPYQHAGVARARELIRRGHRSIMLVLPTGGGKTIVAATIIAGAIAKGKRALFVGPRREIITQSFWKLIDAGVPEFDTGVVMADGWIVDRNGSPYSARRPMAKAQVASIQTLQNRKLPPADVVFWDEAHHATSATHDAVIKHYRDAGAVIVGLTATPCRADGKGFEGSFDVLHEIATPRELMDAGWLCEPTVLGPKLTFADVKTTRGGDYDQDALADAMDARVVVGDIVHHWKRYAAGLTTVAFEASVARSKSLAAAFVAAGIVAEHLDGTMETDKRDAILRRLADGTTQVVCNMGVLTEGWDLPRAKCAIVARPTKSLSLWLQMPGRVLRPWQGVKPIVLDHGGNADEHGRPQDEREWSLEGVKKRTATRVETVRACERCHAPLQGGTKICPACGYVFPVAERDGPAQVEGELVEITVAQGRKIRRDWYRAVLEEGVRKGRAVGWCRHAYKQRWQNWPQFYADERQFYKRENE